MQLPIPPRQYATLKYHVRYFKPNTRCETESILNFQLRREGMRYEKATTKEIFAAAEGMYPYGLNSVCPFTTAVVAVVFVVSFAEISVVVDISPNFESRIRFLCSNLYFLTPAPDLG